MIPATTTPTRRRFGQGVACLPVGAPDASVAIAAAARRPLPGESLTALGPLLALAVLAVLFFGPGTPPDAHRTHAPERPETWIALQDGSEPEVITQPAPIAPRIAVPEPAAAITAQVPLEADPAPATEPAAHPDATPARARIDPRALLAATRPTIPNDPAREASPPRPGPASRRRPGGLPTPRTLTDLPVALAPSTAPAAKAWVPETVGAERVVAATADDRRRALSGSADARPTPAWQVAVERQAFLDGIAREETAPRRAGSRATALPRVSARQQIENEAAIRRAWAAEGWHEVPLDALPDCSPPGRQDALKRRILAAAPAGSACTSTAGSFRFLETRNLNAFLMWSRTHPAGAASPQRAENVCDVLERALHCLANPATKELDPR